MAWRPGFKAALTFPPEDCVKLRGEWTELSSVVMLQTSLDFRAFVCYHASITEALREFSQEVN